MQRIFAVLLVALLGGAASVNASEIPIFEKVDGPQVLSSPPVASKNGPSVLVYQGFGTGYIYQDFGTMGSRDPIAEGGVTLIWGDAESSDSLDFWYSAGHGGLANEIDVSYWHDGSFALPYCSAGSYQAKAAYYFVSSGNNGFLDRFGDDVLYGHIDVGCTYRVASQLSVGIHSKTELMRGTHDVPFTAIERVAVPITFQVTDRWSVSVEPARAWNVSGNGYSPYQLTPSTTIQLTDALSVTLQDKLAHIPGQTNHEVLLEFVLKL